MADESNENQNEASPSKPDVSNETETEATKDSELPADPATTETKPEAAGDKPGTGSKTTVNPSSSQAGQPGSQSNSALASDQPAAPDGTAAESQSSEPASVTSAARVASSTRKSAVRVSPSGGGGVAAVTSVLANRVSSLSTAAAASLRGMIAKSSVIKTGSGAVKSEEPGGPATSGTNIKEPPAETTTKNEPVSEAAVKTEPVVKEEPPDSPEAPKPEAAPETVADVPLKAEPSGAFTPGLDTFSPERERPEYPASAPPGVSASAPVSRGVKIVKEESSPNGRRSSSYLYNDWDRTLYEKTGRPPPGEAHWAREKSAHSGRGRSPSVAGGTSACPHSRTSAQASARSPSARRPRSRSRPGSSPQRRRTFDMTRCRQDTLDQFGRRILYHHCFIEPEFTLRGQRIPVHGARKGSIIAAEDTYTTHHFSLEHVMPPSEGQLAMEKMQRRGKVKKKRRRRKKGSLSSKNLQKERALIEEQRRRLEEEGEKLEEDRIRLQETRRHLEQLEEWWKTEGILILQRDELREQEEKIINAVIEEEVLRIREEHTRLQEEWQFLIERTARQEKEEQRIKDELSAIDEKQEEVHQQEEAGQRRIYEMKAVFDIERRMMEVDRKKLVDEVLTCDAFREAMEDAELGGWETLSEDARSSSRVSSATKRERPQPVVPDPFANIKSSSLERFLGDILNPRASAEPERRSSGSSSGESIGPSPEPTFYGREQSRKQSTGQSRKQSMEQSREQTMEESYMTLRDSEAGLQSADSEPPRERQGRPITARGRPARPSRSMPYPEAAPGSPTATPLITARSEGAGPLTATSTGGSGAGEEAGGAGEIADLWLRRPTTTQRSDASRSAVVITNSGDEQRPVGNREASSSAALALTAMADPQRDGTLRAASAGERQHPRSEGYLDPSAKRGAAQAERRRASATPRLENQERSAPSAPAEGTSPAATDAPGSTAAPTEPSQTRQTSAGERAVVANSDVPAGTSAADSPPPGSRRSSLRSGDASQRHVSFHGRTTVQTLSDEPGSEAEDANSSVTGEDTEGSAGEDTDGSVIGEDGDGGDPGQPVV